VGIAPFCKKCSNHRDGMSTCKHNLIQLKFPQTEKYRVSCTAFEGDFAVAKKSADSPLSEDHDSLRNSREDYLSALDCYYEFRMDHANYTSIYDFFHWCRKKLNV
jgi:hypothetical protein